MVSDKSIDLSWLFANGLMKKMESVSNKQNAKSHKIPNEMDKFCAERYFLDFIEAHPIRRERER